MDKIIEKFKAKFTVYNDDKAMALPMEAYTNWLLTTLTEFERERLEKLTKEIEMLPGVTIGNKAGYLHKESLLKYLNSQLEKEKHT